MSLADSLAAHRVVKGPSCSIAILLTTLPDDDAATLRRALGDVHIPSTVIAKALTDIGQRIQSKTVQRHRRGDCECGDR